MPHAPGAWIQELGRVVHMAQANKSPAVRTSLTCQVIEENKTLFVPPEMPTLQPRSLSYLSALAMRSEFQIAEDRRHIHMSPINEQRDGQPPAIVLGLSQMLQQAGLPGSAAELSDPHRLASDSPLIDLPRLISMTAHALPSAKRVVLLPNKPLVDVLDNDTQPIAGFGCRMDTTHARTLLTHFHGQAIRCIGYSTGAQYVMHLLLAGGPLSAPSLWIHPRTLSRTDVRFRLFEGVKPTQDFGLLYSTFYFNMSDRMPSPWWLDQGTPGANAVAV